MIAPPEIVQTEAQKTAVIQLTIPAAEMMNEFGPAVGELYAELARQGVTPAGPLFAHHHCRPAQVFDFEVGVPVSQEVVPNGRVKPGTLRQTTVARTTYHGPYEGLANAWAELTEWITAAGHTQADNLWEVYVAGPDKAESAAGYRTELNRPLITG
jgi:effector-binding domain-containing protein